MCVCACRWHLAPCFFIYTSTQLIYLDRKLHFWCKRVIIHTFSNDLFSFALIDISHYQVFRMWHTPVRLSQRDPWLQRFRIELKFHLKLKKIFVFFCFNWWLWWMTLSSYFAEINARDAWRTIIGVCTHIKASQVQADTVMIISHVPEKIRELTEVIHTFDCLLLLLRFCLLGCYDDPFVSCQTSQWYSEGREHDVFSVLCLNDIPISTCVNFCQLLCNEIYIFEIPEGISAVLSPDSITDHRAKPQRCSCKLWFLTTWEHSSRSKVKISQGSEICF